MTATAIVSAALGVSFFLAGGGVAVLLTAMALTVTSGFLALRSWRHALRHGWRKFGDDDGEDWPGGGGPDLGPPEPKGPRGGNQIDWDQFHDDFWAHVRSRERYHV